MRTRSSSKRGAYSLIEAAVVLGLLGVVIGGVWVSAASFNENRKVEECATVIFTLSQSLQRLISFADAARIGDANTAPFIKSAGLIPKDWEVPISVTYPAGIRTPFGGQFYTETHPDGTITIVFGGRGMPRAACIKLVMRTSGIVGKIIDTKWPPGIPLWQRAKAAGTLYKITTMDMSGANPQYLQNHIGIATTQEAETMCPYDERSIFFMFSYTRIN
ncbi:MAG: type II secretion system protein [Azonexus sp.]